MGLGVTTANNSSADFADYAAARPQPNEKDEQEETRSHYTEGVAKFQPRVELWQPWDQVSDRCWNLKRFVSVVAQCEWVTLSGLCEIRPLLSQGFKANPGLGLANTFGVKPWQKNKKLSVVHRSEPTVPQTS